MSKSVKHAVTGAFGYTGRYITERLLDCGCEVITLTNSPQRQNPFAGRVKTFPFNFDRPELLTESLQGVDVLYNTYWIRFNHLLFNHSEAVANTLVLFDAARKAGVKRVVHISITNPSEDSPLEYFRGKAKLETALKQSGLSYAILRPAVVFGREDILINNIVWMLRRLPVIGLFGDGRYQLQPIYVEDLADLAVSEGISPENSAINAIGPETFTFRELIEKIGEIVGIKRPIISISPGLGYWVIRFLGLIVGDVILTREEIQGLMDNLLYTESSPVGQTRLTEWVQKHRDSLGRSYANELQRRTNRRKPYVYLKH